MNQNFFYGQNVAKIGTRMVETAQKFGEANQCKLESVKDVEELKQTYTSLNGEFKKQRDDLKAIVAPSLVENFHNDMVNGYSDYVKGTEIMISALDTENVRINEEVYKKGQMLQSAASSKINESANKIAKVIV
ncbi:hypothetical protein GNK15_11850 [Bacillus amyloliquefaciens]|uniref:hypothetical protein n=1 Tax=Bacillus amyloliquefaciens group TaxID=1938374 RepID=UPI00141916E5|nr:MULTISPECIES: hypothetical protein [Bacillus amyloliquefaciens group]MBI0441942.1 hypothetical protein [Bacillus velezensis]NIH01640.1 hypothetical protein [Bacillus amyloliquefaciens]NIH01690.1 hypothetical protein [Bacillus amyloliquefaciens]